MEALDIPGTVKALLVLDMDGFKKINDNLGHLFGDAVISDMALTLAEVFSDADILGRVGGDEFVVLMHDAEEKNLTPVTVLWQGDGDSHLFVDRN